MPPLYRNLAADDLPLPSLLGAAFHGCWLVPIAVDLSFVSNQLYDSCAYKKELTGFLSVHVALFGINFLVHCWTLRESLRGAGGGMRQAGLPRRPRQQLVNAARPAKKFGGRLERNPHT